MKSLCLLLALAACGGSHPAPATPPPAHDDDPPGVVSDTRTAIEKRRDTACEQLGPRLTACAVADAKADLASGKVTDQQYRADTAPEVLAKHTEEFGKKCRVPMSSRQVRVLEVCSKEESACAPLADCLAHLSGS